MTPTERLLAAADLLDKRAGEATEGPWGRWRDIQPEGFYVVGDEDGVLTEERPFAAECNPVANIYIEPDADYIALMDPEKGKLLAKVLRAEAKRLKRTDRLLAFGGAPLFKPEPNILALADLLLAGAS